MTTTMKRLTRPPNVSVREAPFKLRDTTTDGQPNDGLTLDGYASVFNSPTIIDSWEGKFVEVVAPASMKRSFRENPPKIQYDHGTHPLIGSIPIASLVDCREDVDPVLAPDGGAHVIARIFDNWLTLPVRDAIKSNAISGMSFRFEVVREAWTLADGTPITSDMGLIAVLEKTWDGTVPDDELPIRTLLELKIAELGPVCWPAYLASSITVREGAIDLGRLDEPEQRKLLARALFTVDTDVHARGDRDIDVAAREIRRMLLDIEARRERVANFPPNQDRTGWRR